MIDSIIAQSPMASKTISEINERIRDGSVSVLTAEEMTDYIRECGNHRNIRGDVLVRRISQLRALRSTYPDAASLSERC